MPTRLLVSLCLVGSLMGCKTPTATMATAAMGLAAQAETAEDATDYASQLSLKIGKIEPKLRIELPLDNSALEGNIRLEIENPTDKQIIASQFNGQLSLDQGGNILPLGAIAFDDPVVIQPKSSESLFMRFDFRYGEIKATWPQLAAIFGRSMAFSVTCRVTGDLSLIASGKTHTIPVDLSKEII